MNFSHCAFECWLSTEKKFSFLAKFFFREFGVSPFSKYRSLFYYSNFFFLEKSWLEICFWPTRKYEERSVSCTWSSMLCELTEKQKWTYGRGVWRDFQCHETWLIIVVGKKMRYLDPNIKRSKQVNF